MKKELVHGLTETVELKDWDFAIIQASLKLYIKDAKEKGKNPAVIGYAKQLRKKLTRPFARLVKRTKREHRRLENLLTHKKDLTHFGENAGSSRYSSHQGGYADLSDVDQRKNSGSRTKPSPSPPAIQPSKPR